MVFAFFVLVLTPTKKVKIIIHYKGGYTMKTKLTVIAILATLVSACTTGTYMTRTYDDDIYFSPADVPPVAIEENDAPAREKSAQINNNDTRDKKIVLSQIDRNTDGTSTVNNYIYQPDNNGNPDNQNYNMDNQELAESDTTAYYNDDDVKYVINNYYDENDNDLDFAYRINRFHRPYYYSPFFDDYWMYGGYYSPYYSGYYGMNYGFGYDGWYGGFGYPYNYYGGYYSPFSFGFGGYWGFGNYSGYYNGYNNSYYGGGGGFYNDHQVARRRATDMNLPNGSNGYNKSANDVRSTSQMGRVNGRANSNSMIENGQSRTRSINATGNNPDVKNATIVNDRRTNYGRQVNSQTQQNVTSGSVRRTYAPTTTGRTYDQGRVVRQSQNYTPSYNKPRIVNQSNYNSNSYTRPRTTGVYNQPTVKSANSTSQNQSYTQPSSSSSMRQTYRSSSSYSTGSSSTGTRSSSSYNRSSGNSGSTYSAPSRSSSSGSSSYGSGSSSSGSSSSGSSSGSSGSSGGSGHRR
jgi:hypothetical protein